MSERVADVPVAELRIKPRAAPAIEGILGVRMDARELGAQRTSLEGSLGASDFGDAHVLANEVRRDQHETAYPVILDAAGVNGCDRRAVTVPDQKAAPESRRIDHARQNLAGLVMHERYRPWQFRGRRAPEAGTGIGEHAHAGRRGERLGETSPTRD